eukprot:GHVL01023405.1.p1 GENE.GHVL01023405.1~~GHVL01023405.1.p1  ORF type:complete len:347 (+),score=58.75 GHVL01023405.1:24-1064(+)
MIYGSALRLVGNNFGRRCISTKGAITVSVTGSAGQIGYSIIPRVASGELFGRDQPINLKLIEIEPALPILTGVKMEIEDCAFPLVKEVTCTADYEVGFGDCDYAFLVGSSPRGPNMDRSDLLNINGKIFVGQGKALSNFANKNCKIVVIGNPANTNALILLHNAPNIDSKNVTAMTRLDHNRALSQLAYKAKCDITDIERLCIWGNHSNTMYPDISNASIKEEPALDVVNDPAWVQNDFIPSVQGRGAKVIEARKSSSAFSAANGAIDHMKSWIFGTEGDWVSMCVLSNDEYDGLIPKDLIFSYPVTCHKGEIQKQTVELDDFSRMMIKKTVAELADERSKISNFF